MEPAAIAFAAGVAVLGGSVLLLPGPSDRQRVLLGIPPDLRVDQVETLLGTIAGLPARARVISSVEGNGGRLRFELEAARADLAALRAGLQGFAPGVRFVEAEGRDEPAPLLRAHVGWRGTHVLLRRDQPEPAIGALLGVLRSVGSRERMRLRLQLRPVVRPRAPAYPKSRSGGRRRNLLPDVSLPTDQLRQIRNQYGGPLLNVRIEVQVWAASLARARRLLAQLVAVLRSRSGVRGRFFVRSYRFAFPGMGTVLAPPELVPLLGWPLEGPDVPGLAYVRSPQRLPDDVIAQRGGRCFGVSTWPGLERRELHQPAVGALSHSLLLGPTGSGKSSLLARLLLDDIAAGRGALLLDMKGDTAHDLLERIPSSRHADAVVLDPSDRRPVPGLKATQSQSSELTADLWVGLFRQLHPDSFGIRSDRYIRQAVRTLSIDPAASICELPRVFHDLAFRRRLLARAADPLLASAWASFDKLSPGQQTEHIGPAIGRVQDVINRRVVRGVLGQVTPKMTIARSMREGRIVVVRLSPGLLGTGTAQLLGALVVYEVYQAVLARQALAPAARAPFAVAIDEPAVMQLAGVPLDSLFELARGLGVGITVATQSAYQLPLPVQRAVLTNAATIATFRTGHQDATLMAKELVGVTAEQLQHLGQYEIALRLGLAHGQVANMATAKTLPLPAPTSDPEAIRDRSAARFGTSIEETDAALAARWEAGTASSPEVHDAPIGRRRRTS